LPDLHLPIKAQSQSRAQDDASMVSDYIVGLGDLDENREMGSSGSGAKG
jgi:hypothetical protein